MIKFKRKLIEVFKGKERGILIAGSVVGVMLIIIIFVNFINEIKRERQYLREEAPKRGFSSVEEMKAFQAKGFKTKIEFEEDQAKKQGFDSLAEKNQINTIGTFVTKQEYLSADESAKQEGWGSYVEKKQASGRGIYNPKEYQAVLVKEEKERVQAEKERLRAEEKANRERERAELIEKQKKDQDLYCYVYKQALKSCATAANINRCIEIQLPDWAKAGRYIYSCY